MPVENLLGPAPSLPTVKADALGIFGTADPYLTEAAMTASESRVAGRWRYERLEGVGHCMSLEAADHINRLLLDFLAADH